MYICACVSTHMLYRGSSGLVLVIWVRMIRNNPGNAWVCLGLQAPITSNDQHSILSDNTWFSLVSRPPLFLFFGLHSVYNTWKQKSSEKWGRPGSIHHMHAWITSSGCEVEVGREWPNQKKAHWIICSIKCSTTILDSRHLRSWNYFPTHFQAWWVHIWILVLPLCPPCIYSSDDYS